MLVITPALAASAAPQALPVTHENAKLEAGIPRPVTPFAWGTILDVDGDTAVLGGDGSSVTVFRRAGATWSLEASIPRPGPGTIGRALDLEGDTLLAAVGAGQDDEDDGWVAVYERAGSSWTLAGRLDLVGVERPHPLAVAMDGDTAVVAAHNTHASLPFTPNTRLHVFVRTSDGWSLEAVLDAVALQPGRVSEDRLDVEGDTIVVGAHHWSEGAHGLVYRRAAGAWSGPVVLPAPGSLEPNAAVSGHTILLGAPDHGPSEAGVAAVYRRGLDGAWTEEARLVAPDAADLDHFGSAVDLDGDVAIVGATGRGDRGPQTGAAYVFVRGSDGWSWMRKLVASDGRGATVGDVNYQGTFATTRNTPLGGDNFGWSLALDNGTALVGVYQNQGRDDDTAYAYHLDLRVQPQDLTDAGQDDAGTGGDASDREDDPTPVEFGDGGSTFTGRVVPGTDPIDAYAITLEPGAEELCVEIAPPGAYDVRLKLVSPSGTETAKDDRGLGEAEEVCAPPNPEAGVWTLVVELQISTNSSGVPVLPTLVRGGDYEGSAKCKPRC